MATVEDTQKRLERAIEQLDWQRLIIQDSLDELKAAAW